MKRILAMAGLIAGLTAPGWVGGAAVTDEEISAADAQAIHVAVQAQLDAFAEDDAVGAFQLATTDTQTRIGTPDRFLNLVKKHYNPIYRHQLALFSDPEVIGGETIQVVRLTDRDSRVWLAVYRMQWETDGAWKIDGCQLLETTSTAI